MSERYAAYIMIGGDLPQSRVSELLETIRSASVSHEWGDPAFEPQSAGDLSAAVLKGHLWLCDDQSRYGTFPELEAACRKLGLSYTRWAEGYCEYDAELVDWRPGMRKPLVRVSSNASEATYLPTEQVKKVLRHLEANRVAKAKALLRPLCPDVPKLPPFKIV
jgi:hypothetical protein